VHGLLHIAGEDDDNRAARQRMRRREQEILARLREDFELDGIFPPA